MLCSNLVSFVPQFGRFKLARGAIYLYSIAVEWMHTCFIIFGADPFLQFRNGFSFFFWIRWRILFVSLRAILNWTLIIFSDITSKKIEQNCCVFRPAHACLQMRSHGRKWSKALENGQVPFSLCVREALEEKWRKKFLVCMNENVLFSSFFYVFDDLWPCKPMHKHASLVEVHNTKQLRYLSYYWAFLLV